MTLLSPAIAQHGSIPINYTCAGADTSPPIAWHGATPAGTASWAVVLTDLNVRTRPWIQWLVTGIPVGTRSLSPEAMPPSAVVGVTSSGTRGFVGACPPQGVAHRYAFTVYAIRSKLTVSRTAAASEVLAAIVTGSVGHATLLARFAR